MQESALLGRAQNIPRAIRPMFNRDLEDRIWAEGDSILTPGSLEANLIFECSFNTRRLTFLIDDSSVLQKDDLILELDVADIWRTHGSGSILRRGRIVEEVCCVPLEGYEVSSANGTLIPVDARSVNLA